MEAWKPEETPSIVLPTTEGELVLHWFNSRLRTFGDPQYDHVEHYSESGKVVGFRVGREVMDTLFEQHFPMQFDPVVDDATFEWYIAAETKHLAEELEDL